MQPLCPRCGYDQTGEVDRWTDACPLSGRCVECGMEFEWRHVLDATLHACPGHVEHARGKRATFAAAWRTWSWTILPWRFWDRVKLHHRVRPWRLVLWVLVVILLPYLLVMVLGATVLVLLDHYALRGFFFIDPQGEGTITITRSATSVAFEFWKVIRHDFLDLANFGGFPLSNSWRTWMGIRQWGGVGPFSENWPMFFFPSLGAALMPPLLVLLLPDTRSRAKVRAIHVLRAAVYSLAWLVTVIAAVIPFQLVLFSMSIPGIRLATWPAQTTRARKTLSVLRVVYDDAWPAWMLAILLWLSVYWWFALRRGFKVQAAWFVWACTQVCALMLTLSLLIYNSVHRI